MSFVLDTSVVAAWLLPDETSPVADRAFMLMETDRASVPGVWWYEVRNVLLVSERKKRITASQMDTGLRALEKMPVNIHWEAASSKVIGLARTHNLTVYDAAYLALAKYEQLPLATLDARLAEAAKAENIPLLAA